MGGRRDVPEGVGRAAGCGAVSVPGEALAGNARQPAGGDDDAIPSLFGPEFFPRPARPGRTRHIVSPALAARVAELRSAGLSVEATASQVGLSSQTLYRHYAEPLGSTSKAWLYFANPAEAARHARPVPGRPRHMPTVGTSALVRQMVAEGRSRGAIAAALGITEPTLRRHYRRELGQFQRRTKGKTDDR